MTRRPMIYLRGEEPTPLQRVGKVLWTFVMLLFLAIAIESLFVTVPIAYRIFIHSRNSHVHAKRHSR